MKVDFFPLPQTHPLSGLVVDIFRLRATGPFNVETVLPKGQIDVLFNFGSVIATQAVQRGERPPSRPSRRVPDETAEFEPWLNAFCPGQRKWDDMTLDSIFVPDARGRKLNDLLDKELRELRVEVAHVLSEDTGVVSLDVDDLLHIGRVNKWLPLMKCIARRLLKDDFPAEFLAYLGEDGVIRKSRETAEESVMLDEVNAAFAAERKSEQEREQ